MRRAGRLVGILALLAALPAAAQDSPRAAGEAWRAELGRAGPRAELSGIVRLSAAIGEGEPIGTLVLRTDVLERDGQPIYRLNDRLALELPGLGSVRLLVRADVRSDLSALEVVLETEEPRGEGVVSSERVTLRREREGEEERWVRYVGQGSAQPTRTVLEDVPADVIVLTPPLGVGERLARLAPDALGARLSLRALDLETGAPASWRLSVEDALNVTLAGDGERAALRLARSEGPARSTLIRDRAPGGAPRELRTSLGHGAGRLRFADPALAAPPVERAGPAAALATFLRALARGDREGAGALLDVSALYREAGGDPRDHRLRRTFADVLLGRLGDPEWLQARGLSVGAGAVAEDDLVVSPGVEGRVQVAPATAPGFAFVLEEVEGRWLIVDLPRAEAAGSR